MAFQACRCGKWSCEGCAEIRLRICQKQARLGRPNKFLTFTVDPKLGQSPVSLRLEMAEALAVIIKRWRRLLGDSVEYWSWCEKQPGTGMPHFHVFVRGRFLHWSKLLAWWQEFFPGSRPQIKQIYNKAILFRYVKGYLKEGPYQYGTSKRYWKSRGYVLPPEEEEVVKPKKRRRIWTKRDRREVAKILRAYDYFVPKDPVKGDLYQAYWLLSGIRAPPDLGWLFGE